MDASHLHRYFLARDLSRGRDVLEVSSGEGTSLLAKAPISADGPDGDGRALARTITFFQAANPRIVPGDVPAWPYADASFDLVVAFLDTAYMPVHDAFFLELRRVMRPNAILAIGSPDVDFRHGAPEADRITLPALLARYFAHVAGMVQGSVSGSLLMPDQAKDRMAAQFVQRLGDDVVLGRQMSGPAYRLCLASAEPVRMAPSFCIGSLGFSEAPPHPQDRERPQATPYAEPAPDQELIRLRQTLDLAWREVASAEFRLAAVEGSATWKATWPIRRAASRMPWLTRRLRRLAQLSWWGLTGQLPQRFRWAKANRARLSPSIPIEAPAILTETIESPRIHLPRHESPIVSVIIACYGQTPYTIRCLASIAEALPQTPFEIVVAEDASGDPSVATLRDIENIRLIENPRNLGFLLNANAAASSCHAEFLLFLNNDVQVQNGWLDTLVELLRRRPDAAAAGAKLIYPDGRLQEAGGIVWNDGSAWNYGRLDDPGKPIYNYVRPVDYVSGAALMIRRTVFESVGGFDPHFAPAYCEDSDLAFRLRAAQHQVLYQPRAVVVHFEGVSHGTDTARCGKAHQITNTARLRSRWEKLLTDSHFANGTHIMRARDRAHHRKIVLVIDHYVPEPDRDAGSRTIWAMLQALLNAGRVVKFWTDNGAFSPGYTEALQDAGIEVIYGSSTTGFEAWIAENGTDVDGVLLSRPDVAERYLAGLIRHSRARLVYYGHDLHGARLRGAAALAGEPAMHAVAEATEALERRVWQRVNTVLYPSPEEASRAAELEPAISAHAIIPYAFAEFGKARTPPDNARILFVAGFAHPPNEDAAVWLVSEILPLVLARTPGARVDIVGSNPTRRVRELAGPYVTVSANVSDEKLAGFYREARVAVVPLRYGAGVKLKVVEALVQGLPLVTTQIGAQGCENLQSAAAVHTDATGLAGAIRELLSNDIAWRDASAAQIRYAEERFSQEEFDRTFLAASGL